MTMGGSTLSTSSLSTSSLSTTTIFVDQAPLYLFTAALLFFHGSEFALAYAFQRKTLSRRSLLFSWPYALAMASAVVEYLLESALVSRWSNNRHHHHRSLSSLLPLLQKATTAAGCLLVAAGEALRKAAMLTAAQAFTHDLALRREATHRLVTTGPYALMRHPGYAGFAAYAVGTQLILRNPICAVAFAVAVSRFLRARVEAEEALLVGFFGAGYERYAARVKKWGWR